MKVVKIVGKSLAQSLPVFLCALAWQATATRFDEDYSKAGWHYLLRMMLTGAAEATISCGVQTVVPIYQQYQNVATDNRVAALIRASDHESFFPKILKRTLISFCLGMLWQPMVDVGYVLQNAAQQTSKDSNQTYVGSSVSLLVLYGFVLFSLKYALALGVGKPTKNVAEMLATWFFYLEGPLPLPGSPAGNRELFWAAGLSGGAYFFVILIRNMLADCRSSSAAAPAGYQLVPQTP